MNGLADPFQQRFLSDEERADILARHLVGYRRRGWEIRNVNGFQAELVRQSALFFKQRQRLVLHVNDIGGVERR